MINNIEDLQIYAPLNTYTEWETIRPEVESAKLFIDQYIEDTLIIELIAQLATATPDAKWKKLDELYSKFLTNWAIYNYMPKVYSSTSDAGEMVTSTENSERAPKWSFELKRKKYFDDAYSALEMCLAHIHKYCMVSGDVFFDHVSNTYRARFVSVFKNSEEFNAASYIKTNFYTFLNLSHSFMECIDLYIRPYFGRYIDTIISNTARNATETKLMQYIQKIVANKAIRRGVDTMIFSLDNFGLRLLPIDKNETMEGLAMSDKQISALIYNLDKNTDSYIHFMRELIKNDHATLPGILTTPIYIAVAAADNSKRDNYANDTSRGSYFM